MSVRRAVANATASSARSTGTVSEQLEKLSYHEALLAAFLADNLHAVQKPIYKRENPGFVTFKQLSHTRIDGLHTRVRRWIQDAVADDGAITLRGRKFLPEDGESTLLVPRLADGAGDGSDVELPADVKAILKSTVAWDTVLAFLRALKKDLSSDEKKEYQRGIGTQTLTLEDLAITAEDIFCKRPILEPYLDINDSNTQRAIRRFSKQQQVFWVRFQGQKIKELTSSIHPALARRPEGFGFLRRPGAPMVLEGSAGSTHTSAGGTLAPPPTTRIPSGVLATGAANSTTVSGDDGNPAVVVGPSTTTTTTTGDVLAMHENKVPRVVYQKGLTSGNGVITFIGAAGYRLQFSHQSQGLPDPTAFHLQAPTTKENERDVISLTYNAQSGVLKATWCPRFLKFFSVTRANLEGVLAKVDPAQGGRVDGPEAVLTATGIDMDADFPVDSPANLLSTFDTSKFPSRLCPAEKVADYTLSRRDKERLRERYGEEVWIEIPTSLNRHPDDWILVDGRSDLLGSPFPVIIIPPRPHNASARGSGANAQAAASGRNDLSEGELDFWSMFPSAIAGNTAAVPAPSAEGGAANTQGVGKRSIPKAGVVGEPAGKRARRS